MRLFCAVGCVVLACAAWPAAAPAPPLRGDAGRDDLRGTARADVLHGLDGPDRLRGRGGSDRLYGGHGRDRLFGDGGADVLRGGPNGDRLNGGRGADLLRGGAGNDRLSARDGRRDQISCGPGRDRATLDTADVIVDATGARADGRCEVVRRPAPPDASMIAVGDIARCPGGAGITSALVDGLPGTIAILGDTVYERGTPEEFANCYEPTWGRHKARTRPAVGNHEYGTPGAAGYFSYFGAAAGEAGKGYYSYTLGGWHVVALNTNCEEVGGCHAGIGAGALAACGPRRAPVMVHARLWPPSCVQLRQPARRQPIRATAAARAAGQSRRAVAERARPRLRTFRATDRRRRREPDRRTPVRGRHGRGVAAAVLLSARGQQRGAHRRRIWSASLTLRGKAYDWRFVAQPGSAATDAGTTACH